MDFSRGVSQRDKRWHQDFWPEQLEEQSLHSWKRRLQGGLGYWSFGLNIGSLILDIQVEMSGRQLF